MYGMYLTRTALNMAKLCRPSRLYLRDRVNKFCDDQSSVNNLPRALLCAFLVAGLSSYAEDCEENLFMFC